MKALLVLLLTAWMAASADLPAVDAIFAPLADAKSPGLAVLVRKDGKTVFAHGYGVRDLRTLTPIDAATNFRLASVTKQFTAMAVMLLIHDGKLRYDERLTDVFPDFPAYGRAITLRHLLTHTSGLPDYDDLMDKGPWTEARQITDAEALDLIEHASPKFTPGTSWAYSNSGYVVLGLIVGKVSGMPFGDFLQRRIFGPLHMDHTLVYVRGRNTISNRAYGHAKQGGAFIETDQSSSSATQGDGGVYSNLDDLARWDAALERHTLLSAAEIEPAWTPVQLANGSATFWPATPARPVAYGFGWFLDAVEGRARVYHTGSTRGFNTVIDRFTAEKLTVVVLCNRTDLDPAKLALQVADAVR